MTVVERNPAPARQHVLFDDVSWDYYERTLREFEEKGVRWKITYDQGRMEITSPSLRHERVRSFIGMLVEAYLQERGIWFLPAGAVTCKREDLKRGLEPDESYYITHRPHDEDVLDLAVDPPPDLAVEEEVSRGSIPKVPIYAEMGVPEVWRFDGQRIIVLLRNLDGEYEMSVGSRALPELPMAVFNRFFEMGLSGDQGAAVMAFRRWLREGEGV